MTDVLTPEQRRLNMSRIRGTDTKPELIIRKKLFSEGFRYRLHQNNLPGKPDITLPKYRCVIFINGCFWHGHECELFKVPKTRTDFWVNKINRNKERDEKAIETLQLNGWRICIVWECALKGRKKVLIDRVVFAISAFINSEDKLVSITGE